MIPINAKPTLIGLGILVAGIAGFALLVALKPAPPKIEQPRVVPIVSVAEVAVRSGSLTVMGSGTVRPVREANLSAEVAGKVVGVASALVSGGFFQAGEVLVQVDPKDYQNAVAVAEAEVTQREYELLMANEEVAIAKEEWARLQRRTGETLAPATTEMGALALKEPQLKLAEARLHSARARLEDARTRLSRARVVAPFNGRVRTKSVEVGQYVAPGQPVAMVYSTDAVEIAVPLTQREAALIPAIWRAAQNRSQVRRLPATVRAEFGGQTHAWQGTVDRTEGTLDTSTRTVNVVVRVDNPYRITTAEMPPLMVGLFTEVAIEGEALDAYFVIPREALRENDTVWVLADSTLQMRPVEVIQEVEGEVLLRRGLTAGERVITSSLDVVTDGMRVRTIDV